MRISKVWKEADVPREKHGRNKGIRRKYREIKAGEAHNRLVTAKPYHGTVKDVMKLLGWAP